jgi:hypothetical protein
MPLQLARRVSSAALLVVLSCAPAASATLFQQTPVVTQGFESSYDYEVAGAFELLLDATVTTVRWHGFYLTGAVPITDLFHVKFYEDDGGVPGGLTASVFPVSEAHRAPTGDTVASYAEFSYWADLGSGMPLVAGTRYWVAIFNNLQGGAWAWSAGDFSSGSLAYLTEGEHGWQPYEADLYFALEADTPSAVPEPGTLFLLGTGLTTLLARRRRS